MLIVHHLNNSRSQRVLWLLEELGVEYEIKFYQRDKKTLLAPASLREVHPLGKSPVITDGEITVAESGAIIEYLLDTYGDGTLRPEKGSQAYRDYTYWLHYAEGSAMSPLLLSVIFRELPRQGPLLARPLLKGVSAAVMKEFVRPNLRSHTKFWEDSLADRDYFAGEFTAADVQMSIAVESAMARTRDAAERYPKTMAYLERCHARPAYGRAIESGGPYSVM